MAPSKKDKDPSRADRKAKKRKAEDAIPDLPGDIEAEVEVEPSAKKRKREAAGDDEPVKAKKEKKRAKTEDTVPETNESPVKEKKKKSKKTIDDAGAEEVDAPTAVDDTPAEEEAPRKSKKERKAERKAAEAAAAAKTGTSTKASSTTVAETGGEAPATAGEEGAEAATTDEKKRKNNRNREKKRLKAIAAAEDGTAKAAPRFIVFIGNLPFSATTESITAHFVAVHPKSVRHLTQKDNPSKSKGCAFVEFEGYDHMKTCLKLYHHSNFDDGISPARKINVELTAGGGGKTVNRKAKIGEKNQKLNEQRTRRIQEEERQKFAKREGVPTANVDESGIHPSRRTRVPWEMREAANAAAAKA